MSEKNMREENRCAGTLVKICGLRRAQDAEAANLAGPDLAGFILSPGFKRSISPETACSLRRILSGRIRTVGVFVDAPAADVLRAAGSGCIDMVQLHGNEDDAYIRRIREEAGLPVVKAFRIRDGADLEAAAASAADWILLDSGTGTGRTFDWELLHAFLEGHANAAGDPSDVFLRGQAELSRSQAGAMRGQGDPALEKFGAQCREAPTRQTGGGSFLFPGGHRWLLAGGLCVENVAGAIRRFAPTGVDVSSMVETDGWKDPEKMKAFVQAVRNAGSSL